MDTRTALPLTGHPSQYLPAPERKGLTRGRYVLGNFNTKPGYTVKVIQNCQMFLIMDIDVET